MADQELPVVMFRVMTFIIALAMAVLAGAVVPMVAAGHVLVGDTLGCRCTPTGGGLKSTTPGQHPGGGCMLEITVTQFCKVWWVGLVHIVTWTPGTS